MRGLYRTMTLQPVARFYYAGSGYLLLAWGLILVVAAAPLVLIEQTRTGPISLGEVVYLGLIVLGVLAAFLVMLGQADVVIDDEGIVRKRWGLGLQKIAWINVRLIKVDRSVALGKGVVRVINVFPRKGLKLWPLGRMAFAENVNSPSKLIELINLYAARHKIPLEINEGGLWKSVLRL